MATLMDKVVNGLSGTFCFFDDIIMNGRFYKETIESLKEVLQRLKRHKLILNHDKCILGHIIDESGLYKTKQHT